MCLCLTFCYFEHTQHTKDTTLYFSTGLMCRHINSSLLLGAIQGSVQLESDSDQQKGQQQLEEPLSEQMNTIY